MCVCARAPQFMCRSNYHSFFRLHSHAFVDDDDDNDDDRHHHYEFFFEKLKKLSIKKFLPAFAQHLANGKLVDMMRT